MKIDIFDNEILEAFIQNNVDYFKTQFEKIENGNKITWNWWGFFLPTIYLLYRRVYVLGLLIFLIGIFTIKIPFAGIVLGIVVGMFANYWIYQDYKKSLIKAQKRTKDKEEIINIIEKEGGVSKIVGVIAIILIGYQVLGLVVFTIRMINGYYG